MRSFKFVHTADLHLDSPFQGIGRVEPKVQKLLLEATFQAFRNIVQLCIREQVDFLLIAGDLYDGADGSLKAQLRCRDELRQLNDHGIQVFIAHGNHDHCGGWRADLDWPEGVHFFSADKVESFRVIKEGEEVAVIYGISYPEKVVTTNYLSRFPLAGLDLYTIGLLHTNVGSSAGYANYAPCTLGELVATGYDYWALGHVHSYQVLNTEKPLIIYPGTPQGRHPLEIGSKGCCLVEVSSTGATSHRFFETDVLRWVTIDVSIVGLNRLEELILKIEDALNELTQSSEDRSYLVQIQLNGRGRLNQELHRPGLLMDLLEQLRAMHWGTRELLWVLKIDNCTQPDIQIEALREEESLLGDFLKLINKGQNLEQYPEIRAVLEESYEVLYKERMMRKILLEPDLLDLERLLKQSEELGIELFHLEGDSRC